MPPNGWLNGNGGERGIKQRDRSFAGKDLFFKVVAEVVEEAELPFGQDFEKLVAHHTGGADYGDVELFHLTSLPLTSYYCEVY